MSLQMVKLENDKLEMWVEQPLKNANNNNYVKIIWKFDV